MANSPRLRLVGLLGRPGLAPGDGMLLRRTNSIHMFFMRFPIDAVFLDCDHTVVKIVHVLRPWRIAGAKGASSVIELAAGEATARGVVVGDRVCVELLDAGTISSRCL